MDNNYCQECGNKLKKDAIFCDRCGFKVVEEETKTKFCFNCGEKIDFNAEICPKCGVRLINPITNSAGDILSNSADKIDGAVSSVSKYFTLKNIVIVLLIIIILTLVVEAPAIIDYLTPYKEVDSSYIANPVAGEKVQFDGEYIGTTSWGGGGFLMFSMITNNDIVKVGDQYVIIQGDYMTHDLYNHKGSKVHLEGRFADGGTSTEPFGDGYIDGHWFGATKIELIN